MHHDRAPDSVRPSLIQNDRGTEDAPAGVTRPPALAFGHAAKLRTAHPAIFDGVGDSASFGHDARRAGREIAEAAGDGGGLSGLGLRRRLGLCREIEPREGDDEHGDGENDNLLHRLISSCERIPDSWSYIATLGFVLAFIVTADNLGELRAQSRAPEIAAAMAAEGVAEIGRRSDAYSYLSPCPQQTVIDVMGAQSFAIEPGPGGRPLVTIDRPVAAPCAYAGMVIDRRAQQ